MDVSILRSASCVFVSTFLILRVGIAQDIRSIQADSVQPHSVDSRSQARRAEPRLSEAPPPARGLSNSVEPLSNGLSLTFNRADIIKRFGEPPNPTWDSRTFGYEAFNVQVGGAHEEIWRVRLTGSKVALSCGIRVGSRKSDVAAVFGSSYSSTSGQYRLQFSYDGDRVREILIEPANGRFAPATALQRTNIAPAPSRSSVIGVWQFIVPNSTLGAIELRPDGTYVGRPIGGGTWKLQGREFQFTGSLTFNHGRGKLNEDGTLIEFNYQHESGMNMYFVLKKQ